MLAVCLSQGHQQGVQLDGGVWRYVSISQAAYLAKMHCFMQMHLAHDGRILMEKYCLNKSIFLATSVRQGTQHPAFLIPYTAVTRKLIRPMFGHPSEIKLETTHTHCQ